MHRIVAPLCLVLCLALLVTGFALLAIDAPEPDMQLHRARLSSDEAYRELLEADLLRRIWIRRALIGGLFLGALALGIGAFLTIAGSDP